jgi:hypothetical protein
MPAWSRRCTSIAAIAIHAPSRNLVTSTTISTAPVSHAERVDRPGADIRPRAGRIRSVRSSRFQCRTMPAGDSVNETNTPTM